MDKPTENFVRSRLEGVAQLSQTPAAEGGLMSGTASKAVAQLVFGVGLKRALLSAAQKGPAPSASTWSRM